MASECPRMIGVHPLLLVLLAVALVPRAYAIEPSTRDPRAIAKAVNDRDDGNKRVTRMTMTLGDPSGRKRVRTLRTRSMDFPGGSKTLMLFEAPADVRNTGLLTIDYDAGQKDDDQWLYLPSLHRSTRISTSEKSRSFLGTDISYADMTKRDVAQYDYKLLEASARVDGEECWVIEARPRTAKEKKETGYLKVHQWISKSKLMPVQSKAWVMEGRKLKYLKFTQLRKVDGIWMAHRIAVRTVRKGKVESTTVLEFDGVRFNQPSVTDADFTQRRLEQGL
ncbi:MAG: outer membrane lipoprotein-sorting protein [Proteobacteria bacterium]|nr:outer membrane lipoprotein-sorting protein [Pseudomonadota bacterium]